MTGIRTYLLKTYREFRENQNSVIQCVVTCSTSKIEIVEEFVESLLSSKSCRVALLEFKDKLGPLQKWTLGKMDEKNFPSVEIFDENIEKFKECFQDLSKGNIQYSKAHKFFYFVNTVLFYLYKNRFELELNVTFDDICSESTIGNGNDDGNDDGNDGG